MIWHGGEELGVCDFYSGGGGTDAGVDFVDGDGRDLLLDLGYRVGVDAGVELAETMGSRTVRRWWWLDSKGDAYSMFAASSAARCSEGDGVVCGRDSARTVWAEARAARRQESMSILVIVVYYVVCSCLRIYSSMLHVICASVGRWVVSKRVSVCVVSEVVSPF